jgi:molybdopterin synthase catalytic subunit
MMETDIDIRLTHDPLDAAAAITAVTCPKAGGIDVFIGTTRAERDKTAGGGGAGGALLRLDYHAYEEMAVKELRKLATEAKARWHAERIAVWHRLGPVAVGEASVIIAVSCAHRADAFSACRWIIDTLKESVPIWKREVYAGRERWQVEA